MLEINEGKILLWLSVFSFLGVYYLLKMEVDNHTSIKEEFKWKMYDWILIIKAIVPTLIIAIGAGLTIPFINLFFFQRALI